jgi:formylglycine-generating enzyme required for sulfatase activity
MSQLWKSARRNLSNSHPPGVFAIQLVRRDGAYAVSFVGWGSRVEPITFPLTSEFLNAKERELLSRLSAAKEPVSPTDILTIGRKLYDTLFTSEIRRAYTETLAAIEEPLRLLLVVEPPELSALPWETMHDGSEWVAVRSSRPFVRRLSPEGGTPAGAEPDVKWPQKPPVRRLRILLVGASPKGNRYLQLPRINIERALRDLGNKLKKSQARKRIQLKIIPHVTWKELQEELRKDYHIFYFVGHGDPRWLYLDDGQSPRAVGNGQEGVRQPGDAEKVSAEQLAHALEGKETRLVFLAACNTAKVVEAGGRVVEAGDSLMQGFAQDLANRAMLPAVVAMQYPIDVWDAGDLVELFFASLAALRPVDVAMADARKTLVSSTRGAEVGVFTPVLYLQAADATLFKKARNAAAIALLWIGVMMAASALGFSVWYGTMNYLARGEMVPIAAGPAILGTHVAAKVSVPQPRFGKRTVELPAFAIDKHEVTNRQYRRCVQVGYCTVDEAADTDYFRSNHEWPMVQVSAVQAYRFCRWIGRRLPSEAEWEWAAREPDGRAFPWRRDEMPSAAWVRALPDPGEVPRSPAESEGDSDRAVPPAPPPGEAGAPVMPSAATGVTELPGLPPDVALPGPVAVNDPDYALGNTPSGLTHMVGNIWEWTRTPTAACADDPYACPETTLWDGSIVSLSLVTKGYSYLDLLPELQGTKDPSLIVNSSTAAASEQFFDLGFRCAKSK